MRRGRGWKWRIIDSAGFQKKYEGTSLRQDYLLGWMSRDWEVALILKTRNKDIWLGIYIHTVGRKGKMLKYLVPKNVKFLKIESVL